MAAELTATRAEIAELYAQRWAKPDSDDDNA
eukprot:SAG11_NODE_489_length_8994_cov_8.385904_4_plen_31_part_00